MSGANRTMAFSNAEEQIGELLARAWKYDDKPHLLYSFIQTLARQYEPDPQVQAEIIRLMDIEYEKDRNKP